MQYCKEYTSPIGKIHIACEKESVIGLWFENQRYFGSTLKEFVYEDRPMLIKTCDWLDAYFLGKDPTIDLPISYSGTKFQNDIWAILQTIPYGKTMSYKEIGEYYCKKANRSSISYQAIGTSIGHNPISILIPCHRVISSNGGLGGYAGGIDKKEYLLQLEKK